MKNTTCKPLEAAGYQRQFPDQERAAIDSQLAGYCPPCSCSLHPVPYTRGHHYRLCMECDRCQEIEAI